MKFQDFSFYWKIIFSSRAVKILFLSFMCEDIGVAMVTNMISQLLPLFLLYNFISEFHNIFVTGILRQVTTLMWEKIKFVSPRGHVISSIFPPTLNWNIFLYYYYIIAYDISVLEYIGVSFTVSAGFFHFVG